MTWYQPARTIGGMNHAFIMGILGMLFASALTIPTLALMVHYHDTHYPATVVIAFITSFVGAMTFSWIKSKSSHPALINGTTLGKTIYRIISEAYYSTRIYHIVCKYNER